MKQIEVVAAMIHKHENNMKQYFRHCFDMKVQMWRPFVVMALWGLIITACTDSTDNPDNPGEKITTGDDASDKMPFKVTQTVVNVSGKSTKTVVLRYYDDMPHVAYIAVSDFQNMRMPNKSIKVSRTAASQYLLVTSRGETAMVNTADESMTFDDFMSFVTSETVNAEGYLKSDEPFYVRDVPSKFSPAAASVSFNLKKYGINLRGDGKMVYVPLTTLSDIYCDVGSVSVLFNGEKIILTDFENPPFTIDEAFFMKPFEVTERPADLVAYSYGELCFAIDHFYGRPGRNAIDNTIQEKGLDQALSENHRTLLKSTKMDEYVFGLEYLGVLLDDGGHTRLSPINNIFVVGMNNNNKLAELMKKFIGAFMGKYPAEAEAASKNIQQDDGRKLSAQVRQQLLNSDTYAKIGNTMYCIFDDFGPIDSKGWAAYYNGSGPMPTYNSDFRGDICGIVEALDKAAADPEVKNFVLDLTCNNGGDSGVLVAITNLLAGKSSFTYDNVLTKQRAERTMLVDGNFDRVFDDKDKAPRHPQLNIAIMTSHYAFSCGNLLPSLMKDYGYLIIGEKSGGGSCSIQRMCTAEGFSYILSSSRFRLINKAGENIDSGVEPHIALEVKQATGKDDAGDNVKYSDFSAFYAPSVGEQIVNWYNK
jgi:hypothetical protein